MPTPGSMWICEDCGWQWPLADVPWQDSECDACGGEMVRSTSLEDISQENLGHGGPAIDYQDCGHGGGPLTVADL